MEDKYSLHGEKISWKDNRILFPVIRSGLF